MSPSEMIARLPFTLADAFVVCGFGAVMTGLWMTFGIGPTLIVAGVAFIGVGGMLYRGKG